MLINRPWKCRKGERLTITLDSFTKIDHLDGFRLLGRSGWENSSLSRSQSDCRICWIPPAHELKKGQTLCSRASKIVLYKFIAKMRCCLFITPSSLYFPRSTSRVPASPRPRVPVSHLPIPLLGPDYMSRAASVCRDDFLLGITWGEPARLMADVMNHGRPERAWFWCEEGLMIRAGPANAITWKNLSSVSRDPGTAIPGSRLTGPARLSCNREVAFYGV